MRPIVLFLIVLAATALFAAPEEAGKPNEELREQVRATETAFAKSMADRDHAAFRSFLAPEAIFLSQNGALRGADAVAEGWKGLYEGPQAPFSWAPEQVEVNDAGDLAVSTGPVKDPTGKRVGTFVSTWRRQSDGQWKIVLDAGCSCATP